jgi:hypothetical protein
MDLREEANQVLQASAEAIDRPSHHHVELAAGGSPVVRDLPP